MPAGFKQVRHASQRLVSAVGGADQVQRAILDSTAAAQSGRTSGGFGLASILVGFLDTDLTTKRLNLWQVHVKHSQKHSWEVFTELVLYLPMIVLIAALIANFPDTTSVLKQEEVVKRLILDEEIMDPSEDYAKSAESVEALSDVWAWAERVLLGVLYGAPESVVGAMCAGGASAQPSSPFPPPAPMTPQMIFGHNILVGGIQVRQARQPGEATLCPEEEQDCAECFGCQVGGCTDNPTTRALRQAYAWTAVSGRGRLPLANVSCHTRWRGAVDEEAVSEAELPPFGRTAWCVPGQGCSDAAHARPPGAHNTWCEGRFACAYRQQTFSSSLKGSVLFTEDMAESTGPFRTLDYGNVGYGVVLPVNRPAALAVLRALSAPDGGFVDRGTRILAFTLNMYNVNDGHYTMVQMAFHLDITGQIDPYYRLQTIQPMRHFFYCESDAMVGVLVAWLGWTGLLFVLEMFELRKIGAWLYFRDLWNAVDLGMCGLFIYLVTQLLVCRAAADDLREQVLGIVGQGGGGRASNVSSSGQWVVDSSGTGSETAVIPRTDLPFIDLNELRSSFRSLQWAFAVYSFVSVLKLFKYLRFIKRLNLMWRVIDLAAWQLLNFLLIITLLLVAFAVFATSSFGFYVRSFHNLPTSLMSMIQMSTGDISQDLYEDMKRAPGRSQSSVAPAFVTLYCLVFIVVVLNMFVAILTDMYYLARDELALLKHKELEIKEQMLNHDFERLPELEYTLTDILIETVRIFLPQLTFFASSRTDDGVPLDPLHRGCEVRLQFHSQRQPKAGPPEGLNRSQAYAQRQTAVTDLRMKLRRTTERRTSRYLGFLRPGDLLTLREKGDVAHSHFQLRFSTVEQVRYQTELLQEGEERGASSAHWEHCDQVAVFIVRSCHSWRQWQDPGAPVAVPAQTVLHIPLCLQLRLWLRSAFLLRTFLSGPDGGLEGGGLLRHVRQRCTGSRHHRFDPQLRQTVESYLEMLIRSALAKVSNPHDLDAVNKQFANELVMMHDFRYRLLYWLETRYGTELAREQAPLLPKSALEQYICKQYPEAIEELVRPAVHTG